MKNWGYFYALRRPMWTKFAYEMPVLRLPLLDIHETIF